MLKNIKNQHLPNIALIGFMGTGKTTAGKILAENLKREFVDLDKEIEQGEKISIKDIFKKCGEKHFRMLERKILKDILKRKKLIVSCGGGIVLSEKNRKDLKSAIVILLKAKPETIVERLKKDNDRPLLKNLNKQQKIDGIKTLLSERKYFYEISADYSINTDKYDPRETARKIEEMINKI